MRHRQAAGMASVGLLKRLEGQDRERESHSQQNLKLQLSGREPVWQKSPRIAARTAAMSRGLPSLNPTGWCNEVLSGL